MDIHIILYGTVSYTICRSTSPLFKNILDKELSRLITAPDKRPGGSVEEAQLLADGFPGCKLRRRHILLHLSNQRIDFDFLKCNFFNEVELIDEEKGDDVSADGSIMNLEVALCWLHVLSKCKAVHSHSS